MSTKSTIAPGSNFHFYHEALDDDFVYLGMDDVPFEAGYRQIMVAIPVDVWEVIRHTAPARLDLHDKTDEELRAMVERDVDERIAEHKQALDGGSSALIAVASFSGSLPYGAADSPREEQVERGLEYYTRKRAMQRQMRARMAKHEVIGRRGKGRETPRDS